ncbi:MAG: 50S ribosomal protein L21e [Candidatus Diapherotrites archaeon]|nr:50S ribosomal protein L21e [Candidatus Diapherotrites archaeon]
MTNKKAKGVRAKTRHLFSNDKRVTVNKFLSSFDLGDRVVVNINSSVQDGMPHRRFQGLSGKVVGMQGKCHKVLVMQGNSLRTLVVNSAHLDLLGGA